MDFIHLFFFMIVWSAFEFGISNGKRTQQGGLFPIIFNLATDAEITTNATCGEQGLEMYCKLVDHVQKRHPSNIHCGVCDMTESHPYYNHNIKYAIDGSNNWWQSPSIAEGFKYHFVTINLDLKQIYTVAYVIIKAANSPRPGNWILERSKDGVTFTPWQYFAITDSDCWNLYNIKPTIGKPNYKSDSEVICTSFYSRLDPLESGEIHISLVNGRPGVEGPSKELIDFTSARYIRLSLQRIRTLNADLMTLMTNRADSIDKVVTRRYYYSIKDISIGGQCICFGHAEKCPRTAIGENVKCKCEHNTCGDSCERCCPIFNQLPWRPGTKRDPAICEQCNCHGHADRCIFNQTVADLGLSLNMQGEYSGGGVCQNCQHHTDGINCQSCLDGYYRPTNVPPDALNPCWRCRCTGIGTSGTCVKDSSRIREQLNPGDCVCKPGFGGPKCDRCAPGFIGFPNCEPCPCNREGSTNVDTCQGECRCKENVEGRQCDRCKPGFFNFDGNNPKGCSPCFCFGVTNMCHSVKWGRFQIATLERWHISDTLSNNVSFPAVAPDQLTFDNSNRGLVGTPAYWTAPQEFLGSKLISYGGTLNYSIFYAIDEVGPAGSYLADTDILLQGNGGMAIGHGGSYLRADELHMQSVRLVEKEWQHINLTAGYWGSEATKKDFMTILYNLEKVLIRASYHTRQTVSKISNVRLDAVGENVINPQGQTLKSVEQCECPPGYSGTSCETCVTGYRRVDEVLYNGECRRCDCHGHTQTCDPRSGICIGCSNHTVGLRCESCASGYYGDATTGTERDCKPCACPLESARNNFATHCVATNPSEYSCLNCQAGYSGPHCERCQDGYFGDPTEPGNYCQLCNCHGNVDPQAVGNCDKRTGQCLKCLYNTEGFYCETCQDGYYGAAINRDCRACDCNKFGSVNSTCSKSDGQCHCKDGFTGRRCDQCEIGLGNIKAGCLPCACDVTGSNSSLCDTVTGQCPCKPGVSGMNCEKCTPGHYGFSQQGCRACDCSNSGSNGTDCDQITGKCLCLPNVIGERCDQCKPDHHWTNGTGCRACECDPKGSNSTQCHLTSGQCLCKPGVGGRRCDECLPKYWGFSDKGCQACVECAIPGQVCDPKNGQCQCPPNTEGQRCDRCVPFNYGHDPYKGCKPCNCTTGSLSRSCDQVTGVCPCKLEFAGRRCDSCSFGYIGYPNCRPCMCDLRGTLDTSCQNGMCQCDATGQCPCKENIVRKKCNKCRKGTFGLAEKNPRGCTECFCFGRSDDCIQTPFVWTKLIGEDRNVTFERKSDMAFSIDPRRSLLVIPPGTHRIHVESPKPIYWSLISDFRGDKILSYNGKLRFTIHYKYRQPGVASTPSPRTDAVGSRIPLIQLVGNHRIYLEHYLNKPLVEGVDNVFEIHLREDSWSDINTMDTLRISREMLMVALQNVQSLLIRAAPTADGLDFVSLRGVSLDVAKPSNGTGPTATGVELCQCPAQYEGSSCQDPAEGFFREKPDDFLKDPDPKNLIGDSQPCSCNNHSTICNKESGKCFNCSDNTTGDRCELCLSGFYGNATLGVNACRKCACPLDGSSNNPLCRATKSNPSPGDYVCTNCPAGFEGDKCERCSDTFYGDPTTPGGNCQPCSCNDMGTEKGTCDEYGQCYCRGGITGAKCDQCEPRFAVVDGSCKSCDEGCTRDLMETMDRIEADAVKMEISAASAVPWQRLYKLENATRSARKSQEEARLNATHALRNEVETTKQHVTSYDGQISMSSLRANNSRQNAKRVKGQVYGLLEQTNQTFKDAKGGWFMKMSCYTPEPGPTTNNNLQKFIIPAKITPVPPTAELKKVPVGTESFSYFVTKVHDQLTNKTQQLSGRRMDQLLAKAEVMVNAIGKSKFKKPERKVMKELKEATELVNKVNKFLDYDTKHNLTKMYAKLRDFQTRLADLPRYINESLATSNATTAQNKENKKLLGILKKQNNDIMDEFEEVDMMIEMSMKVEKNATDICRQDVPESIKMLGFLKRELLEAMEKLENKTGLLVQNLPRVKPIVQNATDHAKELGKQAMDMESDFNGTRLASADAIRAATVYENIVDAIGESKKAANNATTAGERAIEKAKTPTGELMDVLARSIKNDSIDLRARAQKGKDRAEAMRAALDNMSIPLDLVDENLQNVRRKKRPIDKAMTALNESRDALKKNIQKANNVAGEAIKMTEASMVNIMAEVDKIDNGLKPKMEQLMNNTGSIKDIPNILDESNYNAVRANNFSEVLENQRKVISAKNDQISASLLALRDKIRSARQQANTIRVSLSCSGECVRKYKLDTEPSTINTINFNFKTNHSEKPMMMLYVEQGPQPSDYLTVFLKRSRVHMSWSAGGVAAKVENPLPIQSANDFASEEDKWYRVEAQRAGNVGTLTVKRIGSGQKRTATQKSFAYFTRLDINRLTPLYVGGVPSNISMPNTDVEADSFKGCLSELEFDGIKVGLHNFLETTNSKSCGGCLKSPTAADETPQSTRGVFQFLGYGFSEMPQVRRYNNLKLQVLMQFKTFWKNGLLFISVNKKNKDFFSLEIVDGYVVLQYQLSGTTKARFVTKKKYNTNQWVQINAARNGLQGRLQVDEESIMGTAGPGRDVGLELLKSSLLFGGVPESMSKLLEELNVTSAKYLGCMKELQVSSRGSIPQDILKGNYYGINPGCKVSARRCGFYSNGYIELPKADLQKNGDLSFSFVTMEPDGLIVFARGKNNENKKQHVSISVIDGYIDAQINAGSGGVSIRSTKQYDDNVVHSVTLNKRRKLLDLIVDDEKIGSARLPNRSKIALGDEANGGIFLGGLPENYDVPADPAILATKKGLNGCIFNLAVNAELFYMDGVLSYKNADVGRCSLKYAEANLTATIFTRPWPSLQPSAVTEAPQTTELMTTTTTTEPPGKCARSKPFKDVPRGFRFGNSPDSHAQLKISKEILAGDFDITLDFRIFESYGLIFYLMSPDQSEYLAMQMNNGVITLSYTPNPGVHNSVSTHIFFDDGNWHLLQFEKVGKTLSMVIDRGDKFPATYEGKLDLEPILYVGGLPSSIGPGDIIIHKSFAGCLRAIKLSNNPLSITADNGKDIGTCYQDVEKGAYFSGGAYGIIKKKYNIGSEYNIRVDFRTNRLNGVILSISEPKGFPALTLEVLDGRIKFTAKNKGAQYSAMSDESQNLCDNKWHNVRAELIKNVVTIQVDHRQMRIGIETGATRQLDTNSPVFIGGFPASALPQGASHTNDTFIGCMKRLYINDRRMDLFKIEESNGINKGTCPV